MLVLNADRIEHLGAGQGLSMTHLAKRAGISISRLSTVLGHSRRGRPSKSLTVSKISRGLDVTVDEILLDACECERSTCSIEQGKSNYGGKDNER